MDTRVVGMESQKMKMMMDYKEERNQKGNHTNCTMNEKVSENNDCQGMGGRYTI